MKIYVAAKFEAKEQVRALYEKLRAAGHEITHDWTGEDDSHLTDPRKKELYWENAADADLGGVDSADVLVLVPHPHGRGLFVELGAALARQISVYVVGDPVVLGADTIFFYLPQVVVLVNDEELLEALALDEQIEQESGVERGKSLASA